MHHIAILNKQKDLLNQILSSKKTIESRWYKFQRTPYKNIRPNDTVYLKNSGQPVTAKVQVDKVLFFNNPSESEIQEIMDKYSKQICIDNNYISNAPKNYITLIFLRNPTRIEPFNINKKGFGNMAAWITLENIEKIKI